MRLHIPKRISNLKTEDKNKIKLIETVDPDIKVEEELGLIDFIDIAESRFEDATMAVNNIVSATKWIGERLSEKTDEIKRLQRLDYKIGNKSLRKIYKLTAQLMNEYASRIEVEVPIFFSNFQGAIKALSSMINISDDFFDKNNLEAFIASKETILELKNSIMGALHGMEGFYICVNSLPRIEKDINKAKRNLADKLGSLITDLKRSSQLAIELINEMTEKINRISNNSEY